VVSTNDGAHSTTRPNSDGWNGSEPDSSAATRMTMTMLRRMPASGRTASAINASRARSDSVVGRSAPFGPDNRCNAPLASQACIDSTTSGWLTGHTATSGGPPGATIRQPARSRPAVISACTIGRVACPMGIDITALRRMSAPDPLNAAAPRAPSAGSNERRSNSLS
jgi:hypothetical protein